MNEWMRWNVTRQGRESASVDGYFVSYPKSGRTWFRTFLYKYYASLSGVEFKFGGQNFPGQKRIVFTHDLWENRIIWSRWDRLRGKGLIPRHEIGRKPLVLMARDPRDVVVSLYFQLQKRMNIPAVQTLSMAGFAHHPRYGMAFLVDTMNHWLDQWGDKPGFALVRYEDCHEDAASAFRQLLEVYGIPVDEAAFADAVEFSRFDNMKNLEQNKAFGARELSAADGSDPESFKVRRGKIGGFRDYFDEDDIAYLNAELARLRPGFAYS